MGKSTITFDQHGDMRVEETGFTGNACAQRTDALLAGMKVRKGDEEKKPEFYQAERAGARATLTR